MAPWLYKSIATVAVIFIPSSGSFQKIYRLLRLRNHCIVTKLVLITKFICVISDRRELIQTIRGELVKLEKIQSRLYYL